MSRKFVNAKSLVGCLLATTSAVAIVVGCSGSAQAAGVTNPATPFTNSATIDFLEFSGVAQGGDITNSATGIISTVNPAHPRGIAISNVNLGAPGNPPGTLTNIFNNGTIASNASGIAVGFANLWGTVNNGGTIATTAGNGILIINTDSPFFAVIPTKSPGVLTGITNTGTIVAHGSGSTFSGTFGFTTLGNGIVVQQSTNVNGDISNTKQITADQVGILVNGTSFSSFFASTVQGSVRNSGTIGANQGVVIENFSTIVGSISNAATGGIVTVADGIVVQNSAAVSGGITNAGAITSTGVSGAGGGFGISVLGSTVSGSGVNPAIANNGTITSKTGGIFIGLCCAPFPFAPSTINGDVTVGPTGMIAVTGVASDGIVVNGGFSGSTINGKIANGGVIASKSHNGITVAGDFVNVTKGISNSGTISAGAPGVSGIGINIGGTINTVSGSGGSPAIANSGTINAGLFGINAGEAGGFLESINGDIANSGAINSGVGIAVGHNTTVTGNVTNAATGNLNAVTGIVIDTNSTVTGNIANAGTIMDVTGILIDHAAVVNGAIVNTGTISGSAAAIKTTADGAATTINQNGGQLLGSILLSGSKADKLNVNAGVQDGQITGGSNTLLKITGTGKSILEQAFNDTVGAFTQTGGTLNINVAPPAANGSTTGKSGTIALGSGAALITGGTFEVTEMGPIANYNNHQSYVDVISTLGSVAGQFPAATSDSPFFTASVIRDLGGLTVNLDRISFASLGSLAGVTRNQQATAVGIDSFFNGPRGPGALALLTPLFGFTAPQIGAAADQLSGSQHAQSNHVALNVLQAGVRLIQDRLGTGTGGFVSAGSLASLSRNGTGFQMAALDDVVSDGGPSLAAMGDGSGTSPWSVWARGYGTFGDASSTIDAPGFTATTGGAIIGADYRAMDNLLLGAAASYARTSVSFKQGAGSTDIDSFLLAPYARFSQGDWYLSGVAALGWDNFSTTRQIAFPGFTASASGSHGGEIAAAQIETGYGFHPGGATVAPLVGIGVSHVRTDNFTESGGSAANLAVMSADADSVASTLGVRASNRIDNGDKGVISPEAHLAWQHEFLQDRQKIGVAFAQTTGGAFTIVSSHFGRDAALFGAGVNYELSAATKLFANYDGEYASGLAAHTVSAGFRTKF